MQEKMIVVVLDMDETLGIFQNGYFHVRPNVDFMLKMLTCMNVDIILWSLGDDDYVHQVVNGYLPLIKKFAHKIFARTEGRESLQLYGYSKSGYHIRDMYEEDIVLLGVDDQVFTNMDTAYDFKFPIKPYKKPDKTDQVIWYVCEKLVECIIRE